MWFRNRKYKQKTYSRKVRKDLGQSTYLYGNGYIISSDNNRPKKHKWQVVDTNYYGKAIYLGSTLKNCKNYCDDKEKKNMKFK